MEISRSGLSRRAEQAIIALLTTSTITGAAQKAGIGQNTMFRWLREDELFQAEYRKARRQVVEQALAQVQQATGKAVETLLSVMDDPLALPSSRVAAARTILETAVRAVELGDLETRIQVLEQAQKAGLNGVHSARY